MANYFERSDYEDKYLDEIREAAKRGLPLEKIRGISELPPDLQAKAQDDYDRASRGIDGNLLSDAGDAAIGAAGMALKGGQALAEGQLKGGLGRVAAEKMWQKVMQTVQDPEETAGQVQSGLEGVLDEGMTYGRAVDDPVQFALEQPGRTAQALASAADAAGMGLGKFGKMRKPAVKGKTARIIKNIDEVGNIPDERFIENPNEGMKINQEDIGPRPNDLDTDGGLEMASNKDKGNTRIEKTQTPEKVDPDEDFSPRKPNYKPDMTPEQEADFWENIDDQMSVPRDDMQTSSFDNQPKNTKLTNEELGDRLNKHEIGSGDITDSIDKYTKKNTSKTPDRMAPSANIEFPSVGNNDMVPPTAVGGAAPDDEFMALVESMARENLDNQAAELGQSLEIPQSRRSSAMDEGMRMAPDKPDSSYVVVDPAKKKDITPASHLPAPTKSRVQGTMAEKPSVMQTIKEKLLGQVAPPPKRIDVQVPAETADKTRRVPPSRERVMGKAIDEIDMEVGPVISETAERRKALNALKRADGIMRSADEATDMQAGKLYLGRAEQELEMAIDALPSISVEERKLLESALDRAKSMDRKLNIKFATGARTQAPRKGKAPNIKSGGLVPRTAKQVIEEGEVDIAALGEAMADERGAKLKAYKQESAQKPRKVDVEADNELEQITKELAKQQADEDAALANIHNVKGISQHMEPIAQREGTLLTSIGYVPVSTIREIPKRLGGGVEDTAMLGRGHFGRVYEVADPNGRQRFAAKVMDNKSGANETNIRKTIDTIAAGDPALKGFMPDLVDTYYDGKNSHVIVMEQLQPLPKHMADEIDAGARTAERRTTLNRIPLDDLVAQGGSNFPVSSSMRRGAGTTLQALQAAGFSKQAQKLFMQLEKLQDVYGINWNDVSSKNIMLRPSTGEMTVVDLGLFSDTNKPIPFGPPGQPD